LASARELQDRHPDGSVNRSYYEMFDIARAALLSAGVREDELPRTHADERSTARCGESHSARHLDRRTAALIVPNWMTATGNRLLFALVRQGNEACAVMLEVIENHAYARSRFSGRRHRRRQDPGHLDAAWP
jgi:hypothetical protein